MIQEDAPAGRGNGQEESIDTKNARVTEGSGRLYFQTFSSLLLNLGGAASFELTTERQRQQSQQANHDGGIVAIIQTQIQHEASQHWAEGPPQAVVAV